MLGRPRSPKEGMRNPSPTSGQETGSWSFLLTPVLNKLGSLGVLGSFKDGPSELWGDGYHSWSSIRP